MGQVADTHQTGLNPGSGMHHFDDAPFGPFDAATCLLTLHFLDPAERRRTACEIRRRLKPGAPFVAAHGSFAQGAGERGLWLSRYAAYALASGAAADQANKARMAVEANVQMLSPEQDEGARGLGSATDL
jgi:tRNA (cmo5U34)-methyltransferase